MNILKKGLAVLRNPWTVILGMMVGVVIGVFYKDTAKIIAPIGDIYLRFLQMCVLPIVTAAIISSIGNLFRTKTISRYFSRLLIYIVAGVLLASLLGIVAAYAGRPGIDLSPKARTELGRIIQGHSKATNVPAVGQQRNNIEVIYLHKKVEAAPVENKLTTFVYKMIPKNIFSALLRDDYLKILFFSMIMGVALGFIPSKASETLLSVITGIFVTFEKIILASLYILPIGLACLFAVQFAQSGLAIFAILTKYILVVYATAFVAIMMGSIVLCKMVKKPYWMVWSSLKEALLIAFGAGRGIVAMPSALRDMHETLGLDQTLLNLALPVSISLCAVGGTFVNAFDTVFFSQIYNISLGVSGFLIILIGSIFVELAGSASPSIIALGMLAITFTPLGMPLAPALVILIAVNPLLEPIKAFWNLHTNCLITAAVATAKSKDDDVVVSSIGVEA